MDARRGQAEVSGATVRIAVRCDQIGPCLHWMEYTDWVLLDREQLSNGDEVWRVRSDEWPASFEDGMFKLIVPDKGPPPVVSIKSAF